MAIVQNPLIGQAKQKMGGAVFQGWKDKNVLRTKPLQVGNPQSPAQMAQRLKMSQTTALMRGLYAGVVLGFKSQASSMTEANAFSSHLLKNAFTGVTPESVVYDPQELLLSKGSIGTTTIQDPINPGAGDPTFVVSLPTSPIPVGGSASDRLVAAIIDNQRNVIALSAGTVLRSAGTVTFTFNRPPVQGENLHMYFGYVSPDASTASDSFYLITQVTA